MALQRPGGLELTEKGIEIAGLKPTDKILDIGCGEGDSLAHIKEKYGVEGEGIDMNLESIRIAKEKHKDLVFKMGDGEFLDDYSSFTFDAVMMECVLSLINLPDEALHEAFCVLKKGGKLILSDLYYKNPEPNMVKAVKIEAQRQSKMPKKEGSCEEGVERFVDFRLKGAFLEEPLKNQLREIGYDIVSFEDRSKDLDNYIAQCLMDGMTIDDIKCNADLKNRKDIGYFLLVAQKPE